MNPRLFGAILAVIGVVLVISSVIGDGGARFWTGLVAGVCLAVFGAMMMRRAG